MAAILQSFCEGNHAVSIIQRAAKAIENMRREGLTPDRFDACAEAEAAGFGPEHTDHTRFVNAFIALLDD